MKKLIFTTLLLFGLQAVAAEGGGDVVTVKNIFSEEQIEDLRKNK